MSLFSCSQSVDKENGNNQDCDKLLSSTVSSDTDSLALNLHKLVLCSPALDSFDLEYMGPFIIEISLMNAKKNANHKQLIKDFEKFKSTQPYIEKRNEFYPQYVFKNSIATEKSWPSDSLKLIEMNVPTEFVEGYGKFIKSHYSSRKTHGVLLEAYRNSLKE